MLVQLAGTRSKIWSCMSRGLAGVPESAAGFQLSPMYCTRKKACFATELPCYACCACRASGSTHLKHGTSADASLAGHQQLFLVSTAAQINRLCVVTAPIAAVTHTEGSCASQHVA